MMEEYLGYIILGIIYIISITVHEYAHAITAYRLGDDTPKIEWRLTLNPLKHVSLIGFIMIFLIQFWWWNPVHINPKKFKEPYRDELISSLAWPISNIFLWVIGVVILFVYWVLFEVPQSSILYWKDLIASILEYFSIINFWLAVFNLIPIVPLDWYRLVKIVSHKAWEWMEKYAGIISLVFLVIFVVWPLWNIVWTFIWDVASALFRFLSFPLMQVFY